MISARAVGSREETGSSSSDEAGVQLRLPERCRRAAAARQPIDGDTNPPRLAEPDFCQELDDTVITLSSPEFRGERPEWLGNDPTHRHLRLKCN